MKNNLNGAERPYFTTQTKGAEIRAYAMPTIDNLRQVFKNLSEIQVETILHMMKVYEGRKEMDESLLTPNAIKWSNDCCCCLGMGELAMVVIADILTEGRETSWEIYQDQEGWPNLDGPSWEAVNIGDPYTTTLIRDDEGFHLMCWGDYQERSL